MRNRASTIAAAVALSLAAASCNGEPEAPELPPSDRASAAVSAFDVPDEMSREGRIADGVECPVLRTPDGEIWALELGEADFGPGDYVRVTGSQADVSTCMQGEGTIRVARLEAIDPPAHDRDPARAGGIALSIEYVRGSWVAKGIGADCEKPDFDVTVNSRGMAIIETRIDGFPETGVVDVGPTPGLQWDEPLPTLPIETRGPDGLAVKPPGDGQTVMLAGHRIEGDGIVFVKCAA